MGITSMLLIIVASTLVGIITYAGIAVLLRKAIKGKTVERTIKRIRWKYYLLFLLLGIYLAAYVGDIGEQVKKIVEDSVPILIIVIIVYLGLRVFDGIIYGILEELTKKTETKLDDMLLPIVRNAIYLTGITLVIIMVLAKMGYDVSAFIAGLSISGLAIAMASQEIIKNFFGGIVIMLDGTFKPGDRIKVKGYEGVVKELSLRTTRLMLDDGSLVSIPNAVMLKEAVVNLEGKKEKN